MRRKVAVSALVFGLLAVSTLLAQRGRRFQTSPFDEDPSNVVTPADANEKTEWAFARLRYPSIQSGNRMWSMRGHWAIDYPKADRQFVSGVRRLSRVHARSVEQVVDLDSDDIFNWPWIYAVESGHWDLTDAQCAKLREYLLRGGFLMTDDFHGTFEWEVFMASMSRVFPERPVKDIPNDDAIFHVIFDLDNRFQVPGTVNWPFTKTYEYDGYEAEWKGIYDDKGRVMVAICHNMDLGDAWEHADNPAYPEKYTGLAYRIGINYIVYAMTH